MRPDAADRDGPRAGEYFSGLAALYSQYRPSYPQNAIDWLVSGPPRATRAADVGCGTGISARRLAASGLPVVAIDPNSDMLREARRHTPRGLAVDYCGGTGENVPLAGGTVDLVLCAQSFHWFDALAALREFHRLLAPGGRVALMWNTYDARDQFTARYAAVVRRAREAARADGRRAPTERDGDLTAGGVFRDPERRRFPNPQTMDLETVVGRARSASYWPRGEAARAGLETLLREAFEAHQSAGWVTLHHVTEVTMGWKR
jgi:SAM-dependent methyltransferase